MRIDEDFTQNMIHVAIIGGHLNAGEGVYREILSLPCYPKIVQVGQVIGAVNAWQP